MEKIIQWLFQIINPHIYLSNIYLFSCIICKSKNKDKECGGKKI